MAWVKWLEGFFRARQHRLAAVLSARSCREGWLHGEMVGWFQKDHPSFRVNEMSIGRRKTVDIAFCEKPRMVGEVKVIGGGHQSKVITGVARGLHEIERRLQTPIGDPDWGAPWLGAWGLVPDYFRLRRAQLDGRWERLLVLVADVTMEDDGTLARVLREIRFDGPRPRQFWLRRGYVRIWRV